MSHMCKALCMEPHTERAHCKLLSYCCYYSYQSHCNSLDLITCTSDHSPTGELTPSTTTGHGEKQKELWITENS